MDPTTGVTVAKTPTDAGQVAHKLWRWFSGWRHGRLAITYPHNRAVAYPEWVELEGTHSNPKGHFWLLTIRRGNEYWPQCRINLHPDGRWKERVNVGQQSGARTCNGPDSGYRHSRSELGVFVQATGQDAQAVRHRGERDQADCVRNCRRSLCDQSTVLFPCPSDARIV